MRKRSQGRRLVCGLCSALLLVSVGGIVAQSPRSEEWKGIRFRVLEAGPEDLRLVWTGDDGKPLRTFPAALRNLTEKGEKPVVLMNGGIFEPGGIPSGLFVSEGKTLRPLNQRSGEGNFFLKPNGVFFVVNGRAAVVGTNEYPSNGRNVDLAVQSGPLLLRKGKVHPVFRKESDSRLHRNGVGVNAEGKVVFAITEFRSSKFPNLYEFAEFFRHLGCADALFLDGDISQMRTGPEMAKPSNRFGSIIAVIGGSKREGG